MYLLSHKPWNLFTCCVPYNTKFLWISDSNILRKNFLNDWLHYSWHIVKKKNLHVWFLRSESKPRKLQNSYSLKTLHYTVLETFSILWHEVFQRARPIRVCAPPQCPFWVPASTTESAVACFSCKEFALFLVHSKSLDSFLPNTCSLMQKCYQK